MKVKINQSISYKGVLLTKDSIVDIDDKDAEYYEKRGFGSIVKKEKKKEPNVESRKDKTEVKESPKNKSKKK